MITFKQQKNWESWWNMDQIFYYEILTDDERDFPGLQKVQIASEESRDFILSCFSRQKNDFFRDCVFFKVCDFKKIGQDGPSVNVSIRRLFLSEEDYCFQRQQIENAWISCWLNTRRNYLADNRDMMNIWKRAKKNGFLCWNDHYDAAIVLDDYSEDPDDDSPAFFYYLLESSQCDQIFDYNVPRNFIFDSTKIEDVMSWSNKIPLDGMTWEQYLAKVISIIDGEIQHHISRKNFFSSSKKIYVS